MPCKMNTNKTRSMCVAFMQYGSSDLTSSVHSPLCSVCSLFFLFCSLLWGFLGYRHKLQLIRWSVRDVLDRRKTGSQLHFKERGGDLVFFWVCLVYITVSIIAEILYLFPQPGKCII